MRNLTDQLSQYAAYHRDRRNVATHFIGIPLIILAVAALLGRPEWPVMHHAFSFSLTPAALLFGFAMFYYLWLDVPLGIGMGIVSVGSIAFGQWAAAQPTLEWLGIGVGLFLIGWAFQFVGHIRYEHRKPAFVDDVIGLLIGPLFILVELLFGFGLRRDLRDAIELRLTR